MDKIQKLFGSIFWSKGCNLSKNLEENLGLPYFPLKKVFT